MLALAVSLAAPPLAAQELRPLAESYLAAKAKLKSASPKNRAALIKDELRPALIEIGKLDTAESLGFVSREFNGSDPDLSAACVGGLLANSSGQALEVLLAGFSRRQPAVRKEILAGLEGARRDLKPAEGPLIGLLQEESHLEVRPLLPEVIGKLGTLAAARALVGSIQEPAGGGKAAEAAGAFNSAVVRALRKNATEEIRGWLASDAFNRAPPARLRAVAELAGDLKLEAARPKVMDLLSHADEGVVSTALEALEKIGLGGDADKVAETFRRGAGRSTGLRIQALDLLAASGDEAALDVVLDAAKGGDVETRAIAMGSLSRQPGSQKALAGVLGGLKDSSFEVRNAALRSLSRFRLKGMIAPLIAMIGQEKEEKLRIDALRLLIAITGKNMGLVVDDWRKWWEVAEAGFEFPKENEGFTAVKAYDLKYFGIEVSSKRIAFLVDASSSMLETVPVTKMEEEDGGGDGGGEGPTRVDPKKKKKEAGSGKAARARKIDVLKRELTRVLGKLPVDTHINIIYFHAAFASWKKALHPLAGSGRQEAIAFVKGLQNGTGTNVFDTLEFALKDKRVDTIFLLTDGLPTRGRLTDPAAIRREIQVLNRVRGATINCIAFGEESPLLQELAKENGGVYRFVDRY